LPSSKSRPPLKLALKLRVAEDPATTQLRRIIVHFYYCNAMQFHDNASMVRSTRVAKMKIDYQSGERAKTLFSLLKSDLISVGPHLQARRCVTPIDEQKLTFVKIDMTVKS